jgi:hypothetical protein
MIRSGAPYVWPNTIRLAFVFSMVAMLPACKPASSTNPPASSVKWIDPGKVAPGPVRTSLTTAQVERVARLQQTFQDVDASPLPTWVEDFQRDADPAREIRIYEGMANAYLAYCTGRQLTQDAKRDVYQIVLLRSGAPEQEALAHVKLKVLSVADAKDVLRNYTAPSLQISVSATLPLL